LSKSLKIQNILKNLGRFFLGLVTILQNVSKTLSLTNIQGALFSNQDIKSIAQPEFKTIKLFFLKKSEFSSVQIS